uniref:Homeobox domain-containing protein n=1 Tax=Meloidogyne floridensis TaxID=298350 RepID=A0A915NDA6_9BILA
MPNSPSTLSSSTFAPISFWENPPPFQQQPQDYEMMLMRIPPPPPPSTTITTPTSIPSYTSSTFFGAATTSLGLAYQIPPQISSFNHSYLSPLEFCNDLIDCNNNNFDGIKLNSIKPTIPLIGNENERTEKTRQKATSTNLQKTEIKYKGSQDLPKQRRQRTHFSTHQLNELESLFARNKYPDVSNRASIARAIGLAEQCIRVNFEKKEITKNI